MKKTLFRYAVLFMAVLTVLPAVLAACTKNEGPEVSTPVVTTEEPAPAELVLFGGSETYNVIRGTYANESVLDALKKLRKAIAAKFGDIWQGITTEDWEQGVGKDDIVDNDNAEILVGLTNRRESHTVHESLDENEYTIRAVGKKLVIIGSDDYATIQALTEFISKYIEPAGADKLVLSADTNDMGTASLRKIPINENAEYRIMSWNLGGGIGNADDALEIMLRYLPDIYSLQECSKKIHTGLIAMLPEYYKTATKLHKDGATYVYTPIVYNTKVLTLKDSGAEWLRDRYTGTNTKSLAWAVFEDKNGEIFALINFHGAICFNTYKGFENYTAAELAKQVNEWRQGNARQLLEVRDRIRAQYGEIPVMMNGDCNFNASSAAYKILTAGGMKDAEFTARLGKDTGFKTYFPFGSTEVQTGASIDHIFGTAEVDFVEHRIVRSSPVLTASDHCPVYVDFNPSKK